MPVDTEISPKTYTPIHAPRGTTISCKSWQQEAAMRMLMNNLDEAVAERPQDLVVYGGTGRAARSWEAYRAIVETLKTLDNDETLLVQSGKPVGVFKTHEYAPREAGSVFTPSLTPSSRSPMTRRCWCNRESRSASSARTNMPRAC